MVAIDHFVEVATLMYNQGEVPLQAYSTICDSRRTIQQMTPPSPHMLENIRHIKSSTPNSLVYYILGSQIQLLGLWAPRIMKLGCLECGGVRFLPKTQKLNLQP